jgi:hypothetical protein
MVFWSVKHGHIFERVRIEDKQIGVRAGGYRPNEGGFSQHLGWKAVRLVKMGIKEFVTYQRLSWHASKSQQKAGRRP